MRACKSEDLPAVPGAPRPAEHRLVEWAYGRDDFTWCATGAPLPVRLHVQLAMSTRSHLKDVS
jgi:5-methyltetrahydropteroyltriglutamate--homocysteine methyltransferase